MLARLALVAAILVGAGCGGNGDAAVTVVPESEAASSTQGCAHVVNVTVRGSGPSYDFDVTVRSTETGWDKYADAWEVRAAGDGSVLGVRELLHPHENEQPFTRSLSGVAAPDGVTHVTVAARDSVRGYCGDTMTVALPGRT